MARKSLHGIGAQLLRPPPEHFLLDLQIPPRLRHADPTLPDQSDRLNLKFSRKHSPSHGPPPASANTFSRCPRNRQQAPRFKSPRKSTRKAIERNPQVDWSAIYAHWQKAVRAAREVLDTMRAT